MRRDAYLHMILQIRVRSFPRAAIFPIIWTRRPHTPQKLQQSVIRHAEGGGGEGGAADGAVRAVGEPEGDAGQAVGVLAGGFSGGLERLKADGTLRAFCN
uniref:Uncharacterized protein n=1 Tax=Arcella intermedia TaxID=1963864 RepID=A0A6B2LSE3_9EUKA